MQEKLNLPAAQVAAVVSHLKTTIKSIILQRNFCYVPIESGVTYPPKSQCTLSRRDFKKHYKIEPDYSFLSKLLASLQNKVGQRISGVFCYDISRQTIQHTRGIYLF